jgi:hypothetical protein
MYSFCVLNVIIYEILNCGHVIFLKCKFILIMQNCVHILNQRSLVCALYVIQC